MPCLMRSTILAVLAALVLVAGAVGSEQDDSVQEMDGTVAPDNKPNSYTQVIIAQAAEGVLGLLEHGVKKQGVIAFYTKVCQGHRDLDGDGINDPELTPALSRALMASMLIEMDTHLMEAWNRGDFTEENKDVLVADFTRTYIDLLEVQCEAIHHSLRPETSDSVQNNPPREKWVPDSYPQAIIARATENVLGLLENYVEKREVLVFYKEVCQRDGITLSLNRSMTAAALLHTDTGVVELWDSGNLTEEHKKDMVADFMRTYRDLLEVQCEAIRHGLASEGD